jgi:hypothetical protein
LAAALWGLATASADPPDGQTSERERTDSSSGSEWFKLVVAQYRMLESCDLNHEDIPVVQAMQTSV